MIGEFLVTSADVVHYNSKTGPKRDFRLSLIEMGPNASLKQQARMSLDQDQEAAWGKDSRGKMVRVRIDGLRIFQNSSEVIIDGSAELMEGGGFVWGSNGNGKK